MNLSQRLLLRTLCVSLCLLGASEAFASGFYLSPHGTRPMGRGGAATVGVWDLNALWYNPALLAGISGHEAMLDLNLILQDPSFQRAPRTLDNGDVRTYPTVTNEAGPLPIPQLAFATDLGTERFRLAVGTTAPNASPITFPEHGPQRYTIVDTNGSAFLINSLAVAYRATDWLWVGGSIQHIYGNIRFVAQGSAFPGVFGDAEDPDLDSLIETNFSDPFTLSGSLGFAMEPIRGLQLGASVQLPYSLQDDQAKLNVRLPSHPIFDDARVVGDTISGSIDFPLIWRAGIRADFKTFDVEFNAVQERWSVQNDFAFQADGVEIQDIRTVGDAQVPDIVLPRNSKDTLSLRLGSDIQINSTFTARLGGFWEPSAIPDETMSALLFDADKYGVGFGGTARLSQRFTLDAGYTHVFFSDRTITNSQVKQINATNEEGSIVVGNGTYTNSVNMFGLTTRVAF